jgi:hypothetical protein
VSDVTAVATKVGVINLGASTDLCPNASAFNPADGKFYVLENNSDATITTLYSVDTTSGVYTVVGTAPATMYNLMIDNEGNAFTTILSVLYSLDLTDASTTVVGGTDMTDYCIAVNPATNLITRIAYTNGVVSTISKTTGAITATGVTVNFPEGKNCYALAIDSNGIAWMADGERPYLLFAGNLVTGNSWSIGNVVEGSVDLAVTALMVGVPTQAAAPVLANTGANSPSTIAAVALAGLLAFAGILSVVVVRRRHVRGLGA